MNPKETLKKNNVRISAFAEYAGYSADGMRKALRAKKIKQSISDSVIVFLCRKKGINLEELIKEMIVY